MNSPLITDAMVTEAQDRLPHHLVFDFVICINCGFHGLVEHGADECPTCKEECLKWGDEDNPEFSL